MVRPDPDGPGPGDGSQSPRDRPGGAEKRGYDGSSRTCPSCRENARFPRWRAKPVVTLLGSVRVPRAYDHCRHGQSGYCDLNYAINYGPPPSNFLVKPLVYASFDASF